LRSQHKYSYYLSAKGKKFVENEYNLSDDEEDESETEEDTVRPRSLSFPRPRLDGSS